MVKCVFLPSEASEFRLGRGRRFAVGQKRGGVVEECCFSSCSYDNLLLYCSQVRHHNTWSISAANNDRRYVPVIRAYYPPVIWRLLALSSQRNHLRLFLPLHIPFVWTPKKRRNKSVKGLIDKRNCLSETNLLCIIRVS